MNLVPLLIQKFWDNNGNPLSGGLVYTYQAGTVNPQATYTDSTGGTTNANPIVLNARGECQIWMNPNLNYKFAIFDKNGFPIGTPNVIDNVNLLFTPQPGSVTDASLATATGVYSQAITSVKYTGYAGGAKGDGITDDTAAIQAAVTAALAAGGLLYFPGGNYITTASISNLHNVLKYGPGIIKRSTQAFAVAPTINQAQTIFVSPSGNDANDGLSSSQPLQTLQACINLLALYHDGTLAGNWTIQGAAGSYAGATFPASLRSYNFITIAGPTGARPFTPTMIIGNGINGIIGNGNNSVKLQDVYLQNCNNAGVGLGFECELNPYMYCVNLWILNCDIGIKAQSGRLLMDGGDISGGVISVSCIGGTIVTLGYGNSSNGTGHGAGVGPYLHGASQNGFLAQAGVNGHIDWTTIDTTVFGIDLVDFCQFHSIGSNIINQATLGVRCSNGSFWLNDPTTPTTFSGNGANEVYYSGSNNAGRGNHYGSELRLPFVNSGFTNNPLTGTVAQQTLYTGASVIPGGVFTLPGMSLRLRIAGTIAGAAGAKTLTLQLKGHSGTPVATTIGNYVTAAGWTGDFVLEHEVTALNNAAQSNCGELTVDNGGATGSRVSTGGNTITVGTQDLDVLLLGQLANAADSVTIRHILLTEAYLG